MNASRVKCRVRRLLAVISPARWLTRGLRVVSREEEMPPERVAALIRAAHRIPPAAIPVPSKDLRCVYRSPCMPLVTDRLDCSLWQDRRNGQIWVHYSGGITGVDAWRGPVDASVGNEPGER